MNRIIAKRVQRPGGQEISDALSRSNAAIDRYVDLPLDSLDIDKKSASNATFQFWKDYSKNGDSIQKELAHIARIFLTPPPTSSGKWFVT